MMMIARSVEMRIFNQDMKDFRAPVKSTFVRDLLLMLALIAMVFVLSELDNQEHESRVEQIKKARQMQ